MDLCCQFIILVFDAGGEGGSAGAWCDIWVSDVCPITAGVALHFASRPLQVGFGKEWRQWGR